MVARRENGSDQFHDQGSSTNHTLDSYRIRAVANDGKIKLQVIFINFIMIKTASCNYLHCTVCPQNNKASYVLA